MYALICGTQVLRGRELSNAQLRSLIQNTDRSRRSRTLQAMTSLRAASVISRTNAIRIAASASDVFGLVGGVFIESYSSTRNRVLHTKRTTASYSKTHLVKRSMLDGQ